MELGFIWQKLGGGWNGSILVGCFGVQEGEFQAFQLPATSSYLGTHKLDLQFALQQDPWERQVKSFLISLLWSILLSILNQQTKIYLPSEAPAAEPTMQ